MITLHPNSCSCLKQNLRLHFLLLEYSNFRFKSYAENVKTTKQIHYFGNVLAVRQVEEF